MKENSVLYEWGVYWEMVGFCMSGSCKNIFKKKTRLISFSASLCLCLRAGQC